MADEPVSARRDSLPTQVVRWLRHRPMFLPWIAIFAIFAAVGGVLLVYTTWLGFR